MTIKTKEDLEKKVLEYSPRLRERIEGGDARAKSELERIAGVEYNRYQPFIGGKAQKASAVGHGLGYLGDVVFWGSAIAAATNPLLAPYMLTGLLLKKINAAAQAPDTARTASYIHQTGDVAGGVRNIGAKALSYLPGLTFVDRGLSRIAQRRMVKKTVYEAEKAAGIENKSWYRKYAEDAQEAGYTGVKIRPDNIISPRKKGFEREPLKEAA
jgi:hypothetical protein